MSSPCEAKEKGYGYVVRDSDSATIYPTQCKARLGLNNWDTADFTLDNNASGLTLNNTVSVYFKRGSEATTKVFKGEVVTKKTSSAGKEGNYYDFTAYGPAFNMKKSTVHAVAKQYTTDVYIMYTIMTYCPTVPYNNYFPTAETLWYDGVSAQYVSDAINNFCKDASISYFWDYVGSSLSFFKSDFGTYSTSLPFISSKERVEDSSNIGNFVSLYVDSLISYPKETMTSSTIGWTFKWLYGETDTGWNSGTLTTNAFSPKVGTCDIRTKAWENYPDAAAATRQFFLYRPLTKSETINICSNLKINVAIQELYRSKDWPYSGIPNAKVRIFLMDSDPGSWAGTNRTITPSGNYAFANFETEGYCTPKEIPSAATCAINWISQNAYLTDVRGTKLDTATNPYSFVGNMGTISYVAIVVQQGVIEDPIIIYPGVVYRTKLNPCVAIEEIYLSKSARFDSSIDESVALWGKREYVPSVPKYAEGNSIMIASKALKVLSDVYKQEYSIREMLMEGTVCTLGGRHTFTFDDETRAYQIKEIEHEFDGEDWKTHLVLGSSAARNPVRDRAQRMGELSRELAYTKSRVIMNEGIVTGLMGDLYKLANPAIDSEMGKITGDLTFDKVHIDIYPGGAFDMDLLGPPSFTIAAGKIDTLTEFRTWINITITRVELAGWYLVSCRKAGGQWTHLPPVEQPGTGNPGVARTWDLVPGAWYDIHICTVNKVGTAGAWSVTQSVQTLVSAVAPDAPTGLNAYSLMNGALLEWNSVVANDLSHYNIYAEKTSPPTVKVGQASRPTALWRMSATDTYDYYYFAVKAEDTSGNESAISNICSAKPVFIRTMDIAPDAVTAEKILNQAIQEAKLADIAVSADKIAAGSITETKIADDSISTPKLMAQSVLAHNIAAYAITADKIAAGAITARKLTVYSVLLEEIVFTVATSTLSWTGGIVQYEGITYSVAPGSTTGNKYIVWRKSSPNAFAVEATKPTWALDTFIIGVFESNVWIPLLNATFIYGGTIITETITALEIKADAIQTKHLSANVITPVKLNIGLSDNILLNGSFEIDSDANGVPDCWYWDAGAAIDTDSRMGTKALYIPKPASGDINVWCDNMACGESDNLNITFWAKSAVNNGRIGIYLNCLNAAKDWPPLGAYTSEQTLAVANQWYYITVNFVISYAGTRFVHLGLSNRSFYPSGNTLHVDEVEIKKAVRSEDILRIVASKVIFTTAEGGSLSEWQASEGGATVIEGGKIKASTVMAAQIGGEQVVIAKLGPDALARMFDADSIKTVIQNWRHGSNVTLIDGGDIYTDSVTTGQISFTGFSGSDPLPYKAGKLWWRSDIDELRFSGSTTIDKVCYIPKIPITNINYPTESKVPNESFEADHDADGKPDFWSFQWEGGGLGDYGRSIVSHHGKYAVYINQTNAAAVSRRGVWRSSKIAVESGRKYYFSASIRRDTGSVAYSPMAVEIFRGDGTTFEAAYAIGSVTVTSAYTRFEWEFTVPTLGRWLNVWLGSPDNETGMVYQFDNVIFSEVRAATNYPKFTTLVTHENANYSLPDVETILWSGNLPTISDPSQIAYMRLYISRQSGGPCDLAWDLLAGGQQTDWMKDYFHAGALDAYYHKTIPLLSSDGFSGKSYTFKLKRTGLPTSVYIHLGIYLQPEHSHR